MLLTSLSHEPYQDDSGLLGALSVTLANSIILTVADGVREKDKNTLSSVLTQVAVNKNNSYVLMRHILNSEVRLNWPFYTDDNRQYLKR